MTAKQATIRVSSEGHLVLPSPIQRELGIREGDSLDASIEKGKIVMTLRPKKKFKGKATTDPRTGLPVLSFGPDAPVLTQEQIEEMLADFP